MKHACVPHFRLLTLERHQTDGFMQERRYSSALAVELRLSCINPPKH